MKKMTIPDELKQAVEQCLQDKLSLAQTRLGKQFERPTINYTQRGTVAGSAHYHLWEIRLNATLLIENGQAFIDEVVPHELAHLLVHKNCGRVPPHGKQWKIMMANVLHVAPNRTHQFSVASVQNKTFLYRCACGEHPLTVRRHNRVLRGETRYRCKKCNEELNFSEANSIKH